MSEYRDPRADPRSDDVLRIDGIAVQVLDVDEEVEAHDITGAEWRMPLTEWRDHARNAVVLWQDDAPPAADVALLAAANRVLAERVATLEADLARVHEALNGGESLDVPLAEALGAWMWVNARHVAALTEERDAARRVLLAVADALQRVDIWGIIGAIDAGLRMPALASWSERAAAIRRLCGVSDG